MISKKKSVKVTDKNLEEFLGVPKYRFGSIETDGYDIDLFWTFPETEGGHRFRATWRNTFVGKYEAFGANGQRQPQGPGIEVNDGGVSTLPVQMDARDLYEHVALARPEEEDEEDDA